MQIKTTLRCQLTPTRMGIIMKTTDSDVLWKMWRNQNLHMLLVKMYSAWPVWMAAWQVLKRSNTELLYDPAIPLPGIQPRNYRHKCSQHLQELTHGCSQKHDLQQPESRKQLRGMDITKCGPSIHWSISLKMEWIQATTWVQLKNTVLSECSRHKRPLAIDCIHLRVHNG